MHDKKSISIYSLKYVYDKQSIIFNPKILKIKNKKSKRKITCTFQRWTPKKSKRGGKHVHI